MKDDFFFLSLIHNGNGSVNQARQEAKTFGMSLCVLCLPLSQLDIIVSNSHMSVFINALSLANTRHCCQFVGICNYVHIIKLT